MTIFACTESKYTNTHPGFCHANQTPHGIRTSCRGQVHMSSRLHAPHRIGHMQGAVAPEQYCSRSSSGAKVRSSGGQKGPAATTAEHDLLPVSLAELVAASRAGGPGAGRCVHTCCARMHCPVGLVPCTPTTCMENGGHQAYWQQGRQQGGFSGRWCWRARAALADQDELVCHCKERLGAVDMVFSCQLLHLQGV